MIFIQEITTIAVSASPILELRGGIPLALFSFGFSPFKAWALSVFGNMIPIIPYYIVLDIFSRGLMHRFYHINRFLTWLFEHTRRMHGDHFDYYRWAPLALFVFVAIPLPFTGAWSGVLASVVFGIPLKKAVPTIFLGIIASSIMTLAVFVPLHLTFFSSTNS